MNTGQTIRTIRQEKCLTQKQLAQQVGISASYLCDMEKGRYIGSVRVLEKIAVVLHVEIAAILK